NRAAGRRHADYAARQRNRHDTGRARQARSLDRRRRTRGCFAMTRRLVAARLTAEAFAPFGDVIETRGAPRDINEGFTQRFHDLAPLDVTSNKGHAIVSIFRTKPLALPLTLRTMENHPLGSQAFVPLSGRPFLIVVAPPGPFDANALQAFFATPQQG